MRIALVNELTAQNRGILSFYKNSFESKGWEARHFSIVDANSYSDRVLRKINAIRRYPKKKYRNCKGLIEDIRNYKPNLVIFSRGDYISADDLYLLKSMLKCPIVSIYTDNPFIMPGREVVDARQTLILFDHIFSFSQTLIPVFYQLGARSVSWLPFACDSSHFIDSAEPIPNDYLCDVAYLGAWGVLQEQWLDELNVKSLQIYGPGWEKCRSKRIARCVKIGMGMGKSMKYAVRGAKVVFNSVRPEHGCLHSMKTFELLAAGGVVLTNRSAEQELFLKNNFHAIFYDTILDANDSVSVLLKDDDLRKSISKNAISLAKMNLYNHRANELMRVIYEQLGKY